MIIREREDEFICIAQNDHAQFSGWMAAAWGNARVPALDTRQAGLALATAMHDVGWIPIDEDPLWNEEAQRPYSFMDEPLAHKIPQYEEGVSSVVEADPYAGLLCSLHYTSFFPPDAIDRLGPMADGYVARETLRQQNLIEALEAEGRSQALSRRDFDLRLLKLWDNLSLYVALNEPGTSKEDEISWYRDGFSPTALASGADPTRFIARWTDERNISLEPFPFRASLPYALPHRRVRKETIAAIRKHTNRPPWSAKL